MKPIDFEGCNTTWAKDQEEYENLPAFVDGTHSVSCWKLTWKERLKILLTGRLFFTVLTYGMPLQPQLPTVYCPVKTNKVEFQND